MELHERPWERLPPELAAPVREHLAAVAADIVETVRAEIPAYRDQLAASAGDELRAGVERALAHFADVIGRPGAAPAEEAEFFRALGRLAHADGRGIESLQEFFRVAARVAWGWLGRLAEPAGLGAEATHTLAEATFVFIDELSTLAVEGFTDAAGAVAGERQERRAHVLALLLAQPATEQSTLARAAAQAAWPLPSTLAAVALGPGEQAGMLAAEIGAEVLAGSHRGEPCLLVPDPAAPERPERLLRALAGHEAAIGPAARPELAARSLDWARRTLALAARGVVAGEGTPPRAEDHLAELVLTSESPLLSALAERRLAPLQELAPKARRRLGETLLAWLEHGRSAPAAAAVLEAHPQTVRYRIAQVRELLGDEALDDPDARFEIELALRAERLSSG